MKLKKPPISSTLGLGDSSQCNFYCTKEVVFLFSGCFNGTELEESPESLLCACNQDYCNQIECSREAFEVFGPVEIVSEKIVS